MVKANAECRLATFFSRSRFDRSKKSLNKSDFPAVNGSLAANWRNRWSKSDGSARDGGTAGLGSIWGNMKPERDQPDRQKPAIAGAQRYFRVSWALN
jgi:hypothetical protein